MGVLLVQEAAYAAFRGLLKLGLYQLETGNMCIGGELLINNLQVLLHQLFQRLFSQFSMLFEGLVGVNQGYQLAVSAHNNRFYHTCLVIQFVFQLLRIDVLSV